MKSNKIIIADVVFYIILFAVSALWYSNMSFTGSDVAGNGMAAGLTFIYGLFILFIIGVVFTIINAFLLRKASYSWIKLIFFIPLLLPLIIACIYLQ